MKLSTDTLSTIFGIAAALGQVLGESGIVNHATATAITSVSLALLGLFSNKPTTAKPQIQAKHELN